MGSRAHVTGLELDGEEHRGGGGTDGHWCRWIFASAGKARSRKSPCCLSFLCEIGIKVDSREVGQGRTCWSFEEEETVLGKRKGNVPGKCNRYSRQHLRAHLRLGNMTL